MDDETVGLSVNGRVLRVAAGTTLMEACLTVGIAVPSLCHVPGRPPESSCGVCVVELEGAAGLARACSTMAREGMRVSTSSARVLAARRMAVELSLANHPADCLSCAKSGACALRALAIQTGARADRFPRTRPAQGRIDRGSAIVFDRDKCVLCGRCVSACRDIQTVSALDFAGRGQEYRVAAFMDEPLAASDCVECGLCALACPTGALAEKNQAREAWDLLHEAGTLACVVAAPGMATALGKALRLESDSMTEGSMVAALRHLGFARVFDAASAAAIVAAKEREERDAREAAGLPLPILSGCSPSWPRFVRGFFPRLAVLLSGCKPAQLVMGALVKTWFAETEGLAPGSIRLVSAVPCAAKKLEALDPDGFSASAWWRSLRSAPGGSYPDIDLVLTARELASMLAEAGIEAGRLPPEDFDPPFGKAGPIGVACGSALSLEAKGRKAIALRGLGAAREHLGRIASGQEAYDYVKVLSCPEGCLGEDLRLSEEGAELRASVEKDANRALLEAFIAFSAAYPGPETEALVRRRPGETFTGRPI